MDNCIFCKIAGGEIPSNTVYEDGDFKVILDIAPATPGHCLIIPKAHTPNLFEIDEALLSKAHALSKKIASALMKAMEAEGVNILQNNGEAAGQTVHHYHIHVIPRKPGDDVALNQGNKSMTDEEFKEVLSKIRAAL